MITNNLLEFLNEIQKLAVRIKTQEIINSLIKDDRIHNIINADVILEYYEKMHEHFDKNPEDFLFQNREWVDESLERLNSDIAYNIKDIEDTISKLNYDILEEKERRNSIIPRNTKFIVREMSGLSNKEYKQLFKYYHTNELKKASDPYIKEIVEVLAEDYNIEVDSDFISYAKRHAKPKPDSPFQTIAIIDIINAMIKLKKKK